MESSKRLYTIPNNILLGFKERLSQYDGNKKEKGYLIIKNALDRKTLSFQNLKKIKHLYDNAGEISQLLIGEDLMKFINSKLKQERLRKKTQSKNKERAGMDNPYRKSHTKNPSAKPSFINNSFQIFVNENVLKEFELSNEIGSGTEGEVHQVGDFVVKRYGNLNSVKKKHILGRINIHKSIKNPHLVEILDVKVGDDYIDVKTEKLKLIEDDDVKHFLDHLWEKNYNDNRLWDLNAAIVSIKNNKYGFSDKVKKNILGVIRAHDILAREMKKDGLGPADAFFNVYIGGDNVMQDSSGTWKIIDF